MNSRLLKIGDAVRLPSGLKGVVFTIAAGCVVIEWTAGNLDTLRFGSEFWQFVERDE